MSIKSGQVYSRSDFCTDRCPGAARKLIFAGTVNMGTEDDISLDITTTVLNFGGKTFCSKDPCQLLSETIVATSKTWTDCTFSPI